MASIGNDAGGRRRILFVAPDGKRKTIRLGKVAIRQAQSIKTYVEKLVAAQAMGIAPDDDAVRWLASRDSTLYKKLVKVGLASPRDVKPTVTLGPFLELAISHKRRAKDSTVTFYQHTKRNLIEFFGAD